MSVDLRALRKVIPLALSGVVAAMGVAVLMTRHDTAAASTVAVTVENVADPAVDAVRLPIEDTDAALLVTSADPDSAAFDREGVEWWWRNYQRSHPPAAAN